MEAVKASEVADRLLTTKEVASRFGLEEATLWNWRSLGIGPTYVKLHQSKAAPVRYRLSDIIAWEKSLPTIVPAVRANVEAAYGGR